jgi:hypothetical protein
MDRAGAADEAPDAAGDEQDAAMGPRGLCAFFLSDPLVDADGAQMVKLATQ